MDDLRTDEILRKQMEENLVIDFTQASLSKSEI